MDSAPWERRRGTRTNHRTGIGSNLRRRSACSDGDLRAIGGNFCKLPRFEPAFRTHCNSRPMRDYFARILNYNHHFRAHCDARRLPVNSGKWIGIRRRRIGTAASAAGRGAD